MAAGIALGALLAALPAWAAPLDPYQQGLYLLQQRQYDQACEAFRIALIDQPTNPDALCGLGVALYRLNALQEASQAFDRALTMAASARVQAQARSGLGDIYLQLGEHAAAVAQYRKALADYPEWTGARLNLVRALTAQSAFDSAAVELARILHDRPSLAEAHQLSGELALRRGQPQAAQRDLMQAWSLGRNRDEAPFRQLLQLSREVGDFSGAAHIITAYRGPRSAATWAAIGDTWRSWIDAVGPRLALGLEIPLHQRSGLERLVTEARTAYQRSLLYDPAQPEVRWALAWLERLDGHDGVYYLMPQGRRTPLTRTTLHEAAAFALATGDRSLALEMSRTAAVGGEADDQARHRRLLDLVGEGGDEPHTAETEQGRYWLGFAAWRQGDRSSAHGHWQELPAGIWQELAEAQQAWAQDDDRTAWRHLAQAAALQPDESHIYRLAGEWAMSRGDVGRALRAWEWGRRVGLPDPELLNQLADLQDRLGLPGAAREAWRRALSINPRQPAIIDRFWNRLLEAPLQLAPQPYGQDGGNRRAVSGNKA